MKQLNTSLPKVVTLLLTALLPQIWPQAQAQQRQKLSEQSVTQTLEAVRAKYGLPSLAGGMVVGTRVVTGVTGTLSIDKPQPATLASRYPLASLSKSMTALVVARLIERGKLSWDSKVGDILPDLPMLPQYRTVTVDMLLAHIAGLPREGKGSKGMGPQAQQDYVSSALQIPRQGASFSYSNVDYALLSLMAQKVTGQSWPDLLGSEVFGPLGLTGCAYGLGTDDGKTPFPHRLKAGKAVAFPAGTSASGEAKGGATLVSCDAPSYGKYLTYQLGEGKVNPSYLKPETWQKLHRDSFGAHYAGGWEIAKVNLFKAPVLIHSGSDAYAYSRALLSRERNGGVFVLTNLGFDEDAQSKYVADATNEALTALLDLRP